MCVDCFVQKGIAEKLLPQLERLILGKLEVSISRQLQTQFQTVGKPALQVSYFLSSHALCHCCVGALFFTLSLGNNVVELTGVIWDVVTGCDPEFLRGVHHPNIRELLPHHVRARGYRIQAWHGGACGDYATTVFFNAFPSGLNFAGQFTSTVSSSPLGCTVIMIS